MKKYLLLLLILICLPVYAFTGECKVTFSPRGGSTIASVNLINSAKTNIRLMSYQLTSKPIVDALIYAKQK